MRVERGRETRRADAGGYRSEEINVSQSVVMEKRFILLFVVVVLCRVLPSNVHGSAHPSSSFFYSRLDPFNSPSDAIVRPVVFAPLDTTEKMNRNTERQREAERRERGREREGGREGDTKSKRERGREKREE